MGEDFCRAHIREYAWNGNSWSRPASHMAPKIPCRLKCMWHVEDDQQACFSYGAKNSMRV